MKNIASKFLRACVGALLVCSLVKPVAGTGADLTVIRVAVSPSDDDTAPLLYAKGTGMFEKAGLDVQIQRLQSGSAIASAVSGGAIDIGKSSLVSLINAHEHGIPFVVVASCALYTAKAPFDALVTAKDGPVRSGADLNGKTVSTQSLNDIGQVVTSAWVDQHGGDSKTLHYIEIPTSAAQAAVETRRVEAAILLEPVLDTAMANGKLRVLGHAFAAIAPVYLFSGWFATSDYAKKNADALRRFVATIYKAGEFTNTHHREAAAVVAAQIKLPVEAVAAAQWSVAGTSLDPALMQPVVDIAAKYNTITKSFPARDLLAPAFAR